MAITKKWQVNKKKVICVQNQERL